MPLNSVANEDLKVKAEMVLGPSDAIYGGDFGITKPGVTSMKDNNVEAPSGKKVCVYSLSFSWTAIQTCPYSSSLFTFVSGFGSIYPSSTAVTLQSLKPLRFNDPTGLCMGAWFNTNTLAPQPCKCDITISDAGQEDVKCV
jgi:hypothetical protein